MSRIDVSLFQLIWLWDQLWPEVYLKPNSLALILSAKWSQFTEITLWHWCSPVNLLHTFRTPFPKNTSGELLLTLVAVNYFLKKVSSQLFGRFFNILLREKCPYSELFWSVFSRIRTEYGGIRSISPHSVWMREDTDRGNSECGHFLRSDKVKKWAKLERINDLW